MRYPSRSPMNKTLNEKQKMKTITITFLLSILPVLTFAGPQPEDFGPTPTFETIQPEFQINKIDHFEGGLILE